ncbi:hypothetical protein K501DRAFT_335105 [Backusella circina FSU 941]|nr:hypothetical protein K501DRAFT_335105 [Backusella circina FSU 941]
MTFIKTDPVLLEEQDDLLMSYLNSDYLSNDASWPLDDTSPSTPESTSSSEPAQLLSPSSSPKSTLFEQPALHWPMQQPYFVPTSLQPDVLNGFPFIMPCLDAASVPSAIFNSDFEQQTKKRRGRKKRDSTPSVSATNVAATPSLKSLAPLRPITAVATETPAVIKAEPEPIKVQSQHKVVDQKAAAIAKRQERLIKNRAAALLSRKRKREHLTALEEQNESLNSENSNLKSRLEDLEAENEKLVNENQQLYKRLALYEANETKPTAINEKVHEVSKKSKVSQSGMVLMIILFSFAILALPTAKNNRLPLMSSAHTNNVNTFQLNRYCDQTNKEDEVMEEKEETFFIKSVSGSELKQSITHENQQKEQATSSALHLYSNQLIQLQQDKKKEDTCIESFSLLCPYDETAADDKRLLQIDMQVLGSRIVQGVFNMMEKPKAKLLESKFDMSKRMRRRLAKARVKQRLIKRLA